MIGPAKYPEALRQLAVVVTKDLGHPSEASTVLEEIADWIEERIAVRDFSEVWEEERAKANEKARNRPTAAPGPRAEA